MRILLSVDKIAKIFPGKIDHKRQNWITKCPACGEMEFSISLKENHLCGCFRKKACGWTGNIYTLLKEIGRLDVLINKDLNFAKIEKRKRAEDWAKLELELPEWHPPVGWQRIYEDEYLEGRGFTNFQKYKVGETIIDPKFSSGYVIFLIEEEGQVKGFVARSKKDKKEIEKLNEYYKAKGIDKRIPRYINSGTDFSKLALGTEELSVETSVLIAVEGLFDKDKIDVLLDLDYQKEIKCICTFKCAFSPEQIHKIQQKAPNLQTVILIYDPDVISEIKKTSYELMDYFPNVLIGFPNGGKDPGDFKAEDVEEVLSNLQTPSEFSFNKNSFKKLKL